MPIPLAVPLAISGISALAGLLGNRKRQSTQTQQTQQQTNQTQNVDLYDLPVISGEAQTGYTNAINAFLNQLQADPNLEGYSASGVRNINRQSEISNKLLERTLAQRGLGYSPAATALLARNEDVQSGQKLDFLNSIPLLGRQLQSDSALNLLRAASSIPVGSRRTGTTTTQGTMTGSSTGTVTQPGDMLGGLFSGLGQGLASTLGYQYNLQDALRRYGLTGIPGLQGQRQFQVPSMADLITLGGR